MNDVRKTEKKRIAIHIIIVVVLCVPMAFLWYAVINANNATTYKTELVTATEPCVYVTTYGERYHSADCSYLYSSKHAMGKQEAISKGYTACSRCGGQSSGTIAVTYTKQVEVDKAPQNIGGAIALSVLCTPIVYLVIYYLFTELIKEKR